MPTYFLHLRGDGDDLLDGEGRDYADEEALTAVMLSTARDLIAADALRGEIRLSDRLDAEDETGRLVRTLRFAEAVVVHGV